MIHRVWRLLQRRRRALRGAAVAGLALGFQVVLVGGQACVRTAILVVPPQGFQASPEESFAVLGAGLGRIPLPAVQAACDELRAEEREPAGLVHTRIPFESLCTTAPNSPFSSIVHSEMPPGSGALCTRQAKSRFMQQALEISPKKFQGVRQPA